MHCAHSTTFHPCSVFGSSSSTKLLSRYLVHVPLLTASSGNSAPVPVAVDIASLSIVVCFLRLFQCCHCCCLPHTHCCLPYTHCCLPHTCCCLPYTCCCLPHTSCFLPHISYCLLHTCCFLPRTCAQIMSALSMASSSKVCSARRWVSGSLALHRLSRACAENTKSSTQNLWNTTSHIQNGSEWQKSISPLGQLPSQ